MLPSGMSDKRPGNFRGILIQIYFTKEKEKSSPGMISAMHLN
ncbi:Uncharacterized protein dnm_045640 [Desulfonema magnum]|uniref:Uncharacterized protein n=1 Tax=Desulfonema magnum TaxID=45655 RepID=A0A975BNM7_9BACT|nr:Uncharacterized protein dnm_045640 [Desulfonema magnum]